MNLRFENDVKTYSIQTADDTGLLLVLFENDVKTYSIQTDAYTHLFTCCLRMM